MLSDLPRPETAAQEHSARLVAHIKDQIAAADGWLSFAEYMRLALYAPGLGYYSAGARKLGPEGDFVTAPEISPLFSQCVASQCAEVLQSIGGGVVIEPGAGSGVMAADMLREFKVLGCLPDQYLILETSADLRARQKDCIQTRVPELASRVHWLDAAPSQAVKGVVVANEVADALPVERFRVASAGIEQLGVAVQEGQFVTVSRPASGQLLEAVSNVQSVMGEKFHPGYVSEISLQLPAWVGSVSDWLHCGAALLIDYGFPRHEYYMPERSSGTLRCFYRHRAHDDPFFWPGLQDITAWVDFSSLAAAAVAADMNVAGFTTQAQFLLAAGLDERVSAMTMESPEAQVTLARGLRQLMLPGEMGEAIKVLALTKDLTTVPSAMTGRDMRSSL